MTDHKDHMTEDREAHPERLLAGYVDGDLSPGEASRVDRHLASCSGCREEVGLARRARGAVSSLPALDVPPGLTRSIVDRARSRAARRPVWMWGTGAAAVAAAAAVILFAVLSGGGGGSPVAQPEARGGNASKAGAPAGAVRIQRSDTNYDPAKIQVLAGRLASPGHRTFSRKAAAPSPAPDTVALASSGPLACIHRLASPTRNDTLIEIIVARFQGTPAYIAAFDHRPAPGQPPNLLTIWVASRDGCRLLHYASMPLGR